LAAQRDHESGESCKFHSLFSKSFPKEGKLIVSINNGGLCQGRVALGRK
jgi:type II secretory pathway component PulC